MWVKVTENKEYTKNLPIYKRFWISFLGGLKMFFYLWRSLGKEK